MSRKHDGQKEAYMMTMELGAMSWTATKIEEGKEGVTSEYIAGHELLPADYMSMSTEEVVRRGEKLFEEWVSIKEKKRTIMILAHHGSPEALAYLQEYAEVADQELADWMLLAIDECKLFRKNKGRSRSRTYSLN